MVRPVRPNVPIQPEGEELFGPDEDDAGDVHPVDDDADGWGEALAAADSENMPDATAQAPDASVPDSAPGDAVDPLGVSKADLPSTPWPQR